MVLGLTGGIGMGKSTVAAMFAARGVPGFDADAVVHELQGAGGAALPAIAAAFPGTVQGGVLDRAGLRAQVLGDEARMRALEAIMHPLVRAREKQFMAAARAAGRRAVLLDIPLLFEKGGAASMDKSITVSCPREMQVARVRARGLPEGEIKALIARQMPDADKRALADYVIDTSGTLDETRAQVERILEELGV